MIGNNFKSIPIRTLKRLPDYYSYLVKLKERGVENVSSTIIADRFKLNDIVVRKDLAAVSENGGKPRTGFKVLELMKCIGECLGYYNTNEAVLVGAGQLGRALLSYGGFKEYGVRILAAFDVDEKIIGLEKGGKPVMDVSALPAFCRRMNIRIGIIAVPENEAQAVCDLLVSNGILAVWNFAPVHLTVPEGVLVQNENMALSLSLLSQHLSKIMED
ncbi:MAG: redox-sensing transcriptional repressor Rex [Clostridiaceae bacterium]|nr:redox-sensing transcriptional repressor Rex [Clostridiaceae bacterium]